MSNIRQRNPLSGSSRPQQPMPSMTGEPISTSDPESDPNRKNKHQNAFESFDKRNKKSVFFSALTLIFSIVGIKIENGSYEKGAGITISATPRLGLFTLIASLLFVLPLFACQPQPIYPQGLDSFKDVGKCPTSTKFFPMQACSPMCSSLYYGQSLLSSSLSFLVDGAKKGFDQVLVATQLKETMIRLLRIPDAPAWPLHRLGQPIINALYTGIQTLIPPEKQLIMYATGFMHSAVLRALSKLHIADIIHRHEAEARKAALAGQPVSIQDAFRGKEWGYSLPDSELSVPLDTLAKASCAKPEFLLRLLRAGEVLGVFKESSPGLWAQTEMSDLLRFDHPRTVKGGVEMMGGEQYVALSSLHLTVRSGRPAFSEVYGDFWEYQQLAQREWKAFENNPTFSESPTVPCLPFHPRGMEEAKKMTQKDASSGMMTPVLPYQLPPNQVFGPGTSYLPDRPRLNNVRVPSMFAFTEFNEGMTALASSAVTVVAQELTLTAVDTVVDIAGGHGHLLREILRSHEHISSGVLFDIPSVFDAPEAREGVRRRMEDALVRRQEETQCAPTTCPLPSSFMSFAPYNQKQVSGQNQLSAFKCPAEEGKNGAAIEVIGSVMKAIGAGSGPAAELIEAEKDAHSLCPSVHVRTGSFFEPETIPKAHEYALPILQHKYLQRVRRAAAIGEEVDSSPIRHSSVYVMMQILHDWSDEESMSILTNLHGAMTAVPTLPPSFCCACGGGDCSATTMELCGEKPSNGSAVKVPCGPTQVGFSSKLYIVDRVLQEQSTFINSQGSNFADILMMNNFNDAKERYVADMKRILEKTGFRLLRVLPSRSMHSIVEAEPIIANQNSTHHHHNHAHVEHTPRVQQTQSQPQSQGGASNSHTQGNNNLEHGHTQGHSHEEL